MAHYDILTFEAKDNRPIVHQRKTIVPPPVHFPGYERQYGRMGRKMQALEQPFQSISADITQSELGLDPDYVLVFEVVGGVDSLEPAISKIEGFNLIADEEWREWEGEDDFYFGNEDNRVAMPQRLYAVLSNQRAVQRLKAMWDRYCRGEKAEYGYGPIYKLFEQLHDLHYWGISDRVEATSIINDLQSRLERGEEMVPVEIELWYLTDKNKSQIAEAKIRSFIAKNGGKVVDHCRYDEIKYHALAVQVPPRTALQIIHQEDCEILSEHSVRLLKPLGQVLCAYEPNAETIEKPQNELRPLTYDKPICAMLDGLPLANHHYLQTRLLIDDRDGYEPTYPANMRVHGTGMASLIIHGDLNAQDEPINRPLYVRPIMRPNRYNDEAVPEGVLFPDLLHKAIMDIRRNRDLDDICIVNLSVCDPYKPYMHTMSAEARMIDWLSEKYNILFIVSAGNHPQIMEFDGTHSSFMALNSKERDERIMIYQMQHSHELRLLAPAETVNNLTIGSLHSDISSSSSAIHNDLLSKGLPATYSSMGFGVIHSIKPDAVLDGGRLLYISGGSDANYRPTNRQPQGPGQLVATPTSLTSVAHTLGTSNSAAIATHICHEIYEILRAIPNSQLSQEDMALAIKTMFIHSCSWGDLFGRIKQLIPPHGQKTRGDVSRFIGYGVPDIERVRWSTDDRVVTLGHGVLMQDTESDFEMPLPPCLISKSVKKRLTITLAWNSPISVTTDPRIVRMYFKPNNEKYIGSRADSDTNTSRRGTIQHEIFEGDAAANFEDGKTIKITIGRKRDTITTPVKYMLMVTLEVAEDSGLPIYEEVKARLNVNVPVNV